jgi:Family of unknown function (DUF6459)
MFAFCNTSKFFGQSFPHLEKFPFTAPNAGNNLQFLQLFRGRKDGTRMSTTAPEPNNEGNIKPDCDSQSLANQAEGATAKKRAPLKKRNVKNKIEEEDFFGVQYSRTQDLPDPEDSLKALATGVVEVIGGSRQVEQLARWLSDEVYQRLQLRANKARIQRAEAGKVAHFQNLTVQSLRTSSPRDGVIESVVLLNSRSRTRAVTIRLEGINARWRATSVSLI